MHLEIQLALNFIISYLYNKLPRRRVNIFGEELEKALKIKFQGHWYPDKPFKGSAFRCLKTGDPIDKVLERAARESGVPIEDILENLPQELAVWVDPGEVSYRIGEKGAVKILFSDKIDPQDERSADREVTKTFNPEAQCFRPIDSVSCSLNNLNLSPSKSLTPFGTITNGNSTGTPFQTPGIQPNGNQAMLNNHIHSNSSSAPSPTSLGNSFKGSPSPVSTFIPRTTTPLTFTTATFAQTKFGSTKLKTSSKRANRMSPTEFSNYIKQRAIQQQMHQQAPPHHSPGSRALSPDPAAYYFAPPNHYPPNFPPRSMFESSNQYLSPEIYPGKNNINFPFDNSPFGQFYPNNAANGMNGMPPNGNMTPNGGQNKDMLDNNWAYAAAGQYQHLLVAN